MFWTWIRLILILLLGSASVVVAQESFKPLRGPYMGQEVPDAPAIFLPGKISTGSDEGAAAFYPDARSFLWVSDRFESGRLFLLEDRDGRWQPPRPVRFFEEGSTVLDFSLSPDGEWVYFSSNRIRSGRAQWDGEIWRVQSQNGEFGKPERLDSGVNSDLDEGHPSVAGDGTLYFHRCTTESPRRCTLYSAAKEGDGFKAACPLEVALGGSFSNHDPSVSEDGTFLIFSSVRPGGFGRQDLYVTFHQPRQGWSPAVNLGGGINSPADERLPSLTADGRCVLFVSNRVERPELPPGMPPATSMPGEGSYDLYWMSADFIRGMKPFP